MPPTLAESRSSSSSASRTLRPVSFTPRRARLPSAARIPARAPGRSRAAPPHVGDDLPAEARAAHAARTLLSRRGNVAGSLGLGPDDRCLNVMPLFHIHGLVAALLASLAARRRRRLHAGLPPDPGRSTGSRSSTPTWYTAVPTMHQALLAPGGDQHGRASERTLRFIRSSSAALPAPVLEQLEQTFGVPVIEAYGMTEAAHQMASNPLPPGGRRARLGRPCGRPRGRHPRAGRRACSLPARVGEVAIRGDERLRRLRARIPRRTPRLVRRRLVPDRRPGQPRRRRLPDPHRPAQGADQPRRREDLAARGRRAAARPPGGRARRSRSRSRTQRLGEEVAAAVVLAPRARAEEAELQDFAAQTLAPFKVPRTDRDRSTRSRRGRPGRCSASGSPSGSECRTRTGKATGGTRARARSSSG